MQRGKVRWKVVVFEVEDVEFDEVFGLVNQQEHQESDITVAWFEHAINRNLTTD